MSASGLAVVSFNNVGRVSKPAGSDSVSVPPNRVDDGGIVAGRDGGFLYGLECCMR